MALVGMVQMIAHKIIDVIAVRHRFVTTPRAMPVRGIMTPARMIGGAAHTICCGNIDRVFVHVISVRMMHMAIVQIVNMIAMAKGGMAAAGAVLVGMSKVLAFAAIGHRRCLLPHPLFCVLPSQGRQAKHTLVPAAMVLLRGRAGNTPSFPTDNPRRYI